MGKTICLPQVRKANSTTITDNIIIILSRAIKLHERKVNFTILITTEI